MNYLLDLLQGAGIGAATGIRPFLPAMVVGACAADDLGVDFDGTKFAFLESPWWLLALAIALVVSILARGRLDEGLPGAALQGIGIGLGALLGAGSLDDRSSVWWPGLLVGGLAALLSSATVAALLARVRARLDAEARAALPLYAEAAGVAIAGASVLFPPLALVALGFLVRLYLGGRRREGEKYAGLRSLR